MKPITRNKTNRTKRSIGLLLVALVLILASAALTLSENQPQKLLYLSVEKPYYDVGEKVTLIITAPNLNDYDMSIYSNQNFYKYGGELKNNIDFYPKDEGPYRVELISKTNQVIVDAVEFYVGKPAEENETINETTNEASNNISNQTSNETNVTKEINEINQTKETIKKIITDKETYVIGEPVIASVSLSLTEQQNYKLYYEYEGFNQRYMGDFKEIKFVPRGIGTHYLVLRDNENNEIERHQFKVLEISLPQPSPYQPSPSEPALQPATNDTCEQAPNPEGHNDRVIRLVSSKGLAEGATITLYDQQNNEINLNNSYVTLGIRQAALAEIIPENKIFKRIVLKKLLLNLSRNTSLGIDEIPFNNIGLGIGLGKKHIVKAFAVDTSALNFTNGTLTGTAMGTELWKCKEWNFETQACLGTWSKIMDLVPGQDYELEISPDDPGYAETTVTILNIQSYPTVGGNWTVQFNTTGTGDLEIRAANGTTWSAVNENNDLKFLEIKCGDIQLTYEWINDSVFIANYSCNQTAYEISKVLTKGKHTIEFRFGNDTKYAYNNAADPWWNSGWLYRTPINITEQSNTNLTNYQINLSINTSGLIAAGKMNGDCSDIRFANNASNVLSYYLESGCNTTSTVVWVNTNLTANMSKEIYMYYGNPSASSASNGTNTFVFFDHFDGTSLDSKWFISSSNYSVSGSVLRINNGSIGLQSALSFRFNDGYILEARMQYNDLVGTYSGTLSGQSNRWTSSGNGGSDATSLYMTAGSGSANVIRYTGSGSSASYDCGANVFVWGASTGVWYILGQKFNSTGVILTKDRINTTGPTGCSWVKNITYLSLGYFDGTAGTNIPDTLYDWVLVRKYAAIEPKSAFENEEIINITPTISNIQCYNGADWVNCSSLGYGSFIQNVRANCTSNIGGTIQNATFALTNIEDNHTYFNEIVTEPTGDYWQDSGVNINLYDSGRFNLHVTCSDNWYTNATDVNWSIPFGTLSAQLINPTSNANVTANKFFSFTSRVTCSGGECGYVNATLDPVTWWNYSWRFKKPITLSISSGSTPAGYQLPIILNSSNVGANFNWSNECFSSNSSRARFINSSETGELDFWVDSCSATGHNMTVWVKVDNNITTANYTIYLYYGNNLASAKSNGTATFDFFEDGTSLSGWSVGTGSGITSAAPAGSPTGSINAFYSNSGGAGYLLNKSANTTNPANIIIQYYASSTGLGNLYFTTSAAGVGTMARHETRSSSYAGLARTSSWSSWYCPTNTTITLTPNIWYAWTIIINSSQIADYYKTGERFSNNFGTAINSLNSTYIDGCGGGTETYSNNGAYIGLIGDGYGASYVTYWQQIIIRKYASTTPTFIFGNEQWVGTKGIIPMNSGDPFYTNVSNPMYSDTNPCLANMEDGSTCDTTWAVNATGAIGTTWAFFTIYSSMNYSNNVSTINSNSINITILGNAPPNVSSIFIVPSNPNYATDLNCNFTVIDVNTLDPLTANLSWYRNNTLVSSETIGVSNGISNQRTLGSGNLTAGQVWYCSVIPYDGTSYGNQANSSNVTILSILPPVINQIQCKNGATWGNCSNILYGTTLTAVRVNCTDADGYVTNVTFNFTNLEDSKTFFTGAIANTTLGYFIFDNNDITINDSGTFNLSVTCYDNDNSSTAGYSQWNLPWGKLSATLVDPLTNRSVAQNRFFSFTSRVTCSGGECGYVNATLDPSGPWWNYNWRYKKQINLSVGSGATPADYQVKLVLNSSNVGANWNWSSECVNDAGSRFRFVNGSESVELPYWVENCSVSGQNMSVWVKVDQSITASNYSMYLYYGNAQATNKSNGTATFDFFDDFSGDLSKWTVEKTSGVYPRIENSVMVAGGGSTSDPYGHTSLGSSASYSGFSNGIIEGKVNFSSDGAIGEVAFRGSYGSNTGYKSRMDDRAGYGLSHLKPPYSGWDFLTGCTATGTAPPNNQWLDFRIIVNGSTFNVSVGGQSIVCTDSTYSSAGEIALQNHYGTSTQYDNIRVRKYSTSDLNASYGAEQMTSFKGIIPMNSGNPFYTNVSNPMYSDTKLCLASMGNGSTCDTTWTVNATGPMNGTYEFFATYTSMNYSSYVFENDTPSVYINITGTVSPTISNISCLKNGASWVNCTTIVFGDTITSVKANCKSNMEGSINNVSFMLKNINDNRVYFNTTVTSQTNGSWINNNTNLTIYDSGGFNLHVTCIESPLISEQDVNWSIPFGTLTAKLISPNSNINVTQNAFFNFTAQINCSGGECGYVNATLDPISWWNSSWLYRAPINITEQSNTNLTNYQINLSINTSGLIALGKMNSDCSDVRFADNASNTLSYYIASGCNTTNTTIWIKTNLTANTTSTIYMYYGNPSANSASNGTATFAFFDDFDGTSLDSKWFNSSLNYSVSGSILRINNGSIGLVNPLSFNFNDGYILEARIQYNQTIAGYSGTLSGQSARWTSSGNGGSAATSLYMTGSPTDVVRYTGSGSAASYNCGAGPTVWTPYSPGVWYILGQKFNSTGVILTKDRINTTGPTGCGWVKNITYLSLGYFDGTASTDILDTLYDWVLVRKYATTEPISTTGNEEVITKGAVSTTPGATPFYTITSNPMYANSTSCLANMIAGSSCNTTWTVNATGTPGSKWEFYVIYASMNYSINVSNVTSPHVNITIRNNYAPYVSSVFIVPPDPSYLSDLNCTFTVVDANYFDTLTANVSWYKNGVLSYSEVVGVPNNAQIGRILSSGNLSAGQVWYCAVTPYDGTSYGNQANSSNVTILSSQPPKVNSIQCQENGSTWSTCNNILYNDNLTAVKANCTAFNGTITNATFTLINIEHNQTIFTGTTTNNSQGYLIYDNNDTKITNSGTYNLSVTCYDNNNTPGFNYTNWTVAWGTLSAQLISPNTSVNITSNRFFNFTASITCNGGECGYVNATLDPISWWNSSWLYRTPINITELSNTNLTNYQINLSINTSSLIALGKMNSNCSDIRFIDNASNQLDYYIASGCNTTNTTIWLKTNLTANATSTMNMYYGNPAANSASNGTATFAFFDDFDGTSLDSKWFNSSLNFSVSGSVLRINNGAIGLNNSLPFNLNDGYILEARIQYNETIANYSGTLSGQSSRWTQGGNAGSAATSLYMANNVPTYDISRWTGSGSSAGYDCGIGAVWLSSNGVWYILGQKFNSTGVTLTKDRATDYGPYTCAWTKSINYLSIGYFDGSSGTNIPDTLYDWVLVRKYATTEPRYILGTEAARDKGDIPMNSGIPFYTITQNPANSSTFYCLANMVAGASCNTTWTVNATGPVGSKWEFYTIYAATNFSSYVNSTNSTRVNLTIINNIVPNVTAISLIPQYPVLTDSLNCTFTVVDSSPLDALSANVTWYKNGVYNNSVVVSVTSGVSTSVFLGSGNLTLGDVWHCGVTPQDQDAAGSQVNSSNVTLLAAKPPSINQVQCLENNSIWENCSSLVFGDVFSGVRANCTSENQQVTNVTFNLTNVPHAYIYFSNASTNNGSDWWMFYMNITMNYSGEYRLYTICYNNRSDNFTTLTNWTIPWGTLVANLTNPTSSTNVQRYNLFNFSANISCVGGECGNVNAAAQALVWWNSSWLYRTPINITEQSNTNLTNYQINLSVNTSGLIALGKMNSNCSDMRFVDNASNAISYYVASGCNTTNTTVWVKTNLTANTTSTIYMYYGNPSANSASNGTTTFAFFDDFDGTSLDSKWFISSSDYNVSGSVLRINVGAIGLQNSLPFNLNDGYLLESRIQYNQTTTTYSGTLSGQSNRWTQSGNGGADATSLYFLAGDGTTNVVRYTGSGSAASYNCGGGATVWTLSTGAWYILGQKFNSTGVTLTKDRTNNSAPYGCGWVKNITYLSLGYFSGDSATNISDTLYDWVLVRKYATTEPTYILGTEAAQSNNIPMNSGTPFYTITQNPANSSTFYCLANMLAGTTCNVTWIINATGNVNTKWEVLVSFNSTSFPTYVSSVQTRHINLTITDSALIPPVVTLQYPNNSYYTSNANVVFNCSATDNTGLSNMTLYLKYKLGLFQANGTNNIGGTSNSTTFPRTLQEGAYTWNCLAYDIDGNLDWGDNNRTLTIDYTAPTINLSTPVNNENISASFVTFNFTVRDTVDSTLNCNITIDSTVMDANFTANASAQINRTIGNQTPGNHYWNVTCWDHAQNVNSSVTRMYTIANFAPNVTLITPDNFSQQSTTIILQYNATDSTNISLAVLYINGVANATNNTVVNGQISNFTVYGLAEGRYNWTVNVTNVYNLTAQAPVKWFTIDYTPPSINLSAPPNNSSTNQSYASFNFTATDNINNTLTCNITINSIVRASNLSANISVMTSKNISNLSNGNNYWNVTCWDKAGNINTSDTWRLNVSSPPSVVLNAPYDNYSQSSADIVLNYTPTDASGLSKCDLYINNQFNQSNSTPINNGIQNSFNLFNLIPSRYNWTVNCTSTIGLSAKPNPISFTIDIVKPTITLNLPQPNQTIYSQTILFNYTAVDDFTPTLHCNLTIDGSVNVSNISSSNNVSVNISVDITTQATHFWNVTCWDDAGNTNISETRNFTNRIPPTVTLSSPGINAILNYGQNVVFSYIPFDAVGLQNASLIINGVINKTDNNTANGFTNYFYLNLTDGIYTWTVNATNTVGLTGTATVRNLTIDTAPPNVIYNHPYNSEVMGWNNVTFNFTALDNLSKNMTCNVTINGTLEYTNMNVTNGTPVIFNKTMNDGNYSWSVTCVDNANWTNSYTLINFTVYAPPNVTLNWPTGHYRTNAINVTLNYTPRDAIGIQNCTLYYDGVMNSTQIVVQKNQPNYFSLVNLSQGEHNWTVQCIDAAPDYNSYTPPAEFFIIDRTGPNITLLLPNNGDYLSANVLFNWTAVDYNNTYINCSLFIDSVFNKSLNQFSGTNFNITVYNLSNGPHNWSVNCTDDIGNWNVSETRNFTINQPDLYIDNNRLSFNNTNPDLYQTIQIRANVSNLGGVSANNVLVEFWDNGMPGIGTFIGNATATVPINSSMFFNTTWNITPGYHTIYVLVDPYNNISEMNETNNNATINISALFSNITYPQNYTLIKNNTPRINFNVTDYTANNITYSIYVDGSFNSQTGNVTSGSNTSINLNALGDGTHLIKVQAIDTLGRSKNSSILNITIDTLSPIVYFETKNGTWFNYSTPNIHFNITDIVDTNINYSVYVNSSFEQAGNISRNTSTSVSLSPRSDGSYNVTIQATDDANNTANYSIIIFIDTTPPGVVLTYPVNGANFTNTSVTLNFTATDNLDPSLTCNLTLDGIVNRSNFEANNTQETSTLLTGLAEATHYWNVTCWDNASNINTSETRSFKVFIAPKINLTSPANGNFSNNPNQTFYFNVSDDTGIFNCSLIFNGVINTTKPGNQITNNATNNFTITGLDGFYMWNVTCFDNTSLLVQGFSETWNLTVDLYPPIPNITTPNYKWFNTSTPNITFIITDNFDTMINYTFYVNGSVNAIGAAANNSPGSTNLLSLGSNSSYWVVLQATDDAGNAMNSSSITIYVDTVKPGINLSAPQPNATFNTNTVQFNFTATDNMAPYLMCNLTISNGINQTNINATSGVIQNITKGGFVSGTYFWNVSCIDLAGNKNISETRNFTVLAPDLVITSSNISFSDNYPQEGNNITIYANIYNIGGSPANNVTVQFWKGDPGAGGTQIDGNQTITSLSNSNNITLNLIYTTVIGNNNIFVVVDPPIATNGSIIEENESNNKANNSFSVSLYQIYAGNTTTVIDLERQSINRSLFMWDVTNATGSNIFVTDLEANPNFNALQAIGRNTTNGSASDDFVEIDSKLGTTNYSDSINNTFTVSGAPKATKAFTIFAKTINNVPIINSTTTSNFVTGILWDTSDGNAQYNGTQDLVFNTEINKNQQGSQGISDFEIKVPALLRNYNAAGTSLAFYVELK